MKAESETSLANFFPTLLCDTTSRNICQLAVKTKKSSRGGGHFELDAAADKKISIFITSPSGYHRRHQNQRSQVNKQTRKGATISTLDAFF